MTASGVATHAGITEWNEDDAAVKRAALASAGRCIVACDSSKFGQAAFARVAAITEVEIIITDNGVDPVMRRELEELGSRVEIARPLTEWLSVAGTRRRGHRRHERLIAPLTPAHALAGATSRRSAP